jgi:UDP:flavonoid glycosyltransferase YjiC (YdhE family)
LEAKSSDEVGAFMDEVSDTDVVISGLTSVFYTQQYIRKHNIPHILLALQPTIATRSPSATFEPFVKHRDHPLNLWAWANFLRRHVVYLRRHAAHLGTTRMGLPPETMRQAIHGFRNLPIIHAISPLVTPHATDFPPTLHTTGYLFMDVDANWQPSPTLSAFLEEGEPPVYLGFGSMGGRNVESITQNVLDALVKSGQRGIISSGWAGLYAENLPGNIYLLTESVLASLAFPTLSGGGTSWRCWHNSGGITRGCPPNDCPHIVDQPDWGRRVL